MALRGRTGLWSLAEAAGHPRQPGRGAQKGAGEEACRCWHLGSGGRTAGEGRWIVKWGRAGT